MLSAMTNNRVIASDGVDADRDDNNVERAINIVVSANDDQIEKILEILFAE